ncbi:MAG: hypothetical protein KatS3mg114_0979 [Planctomycetaceae bacterium]|nr:MAG: hypothetical protein KatS3mg114_0979 [Planctomycetaceae bacterium]
MDHDPFRLQRFVEAQQTSYERALQELQAGQKRSHWMWYIFPQLAGLGWSPTSRYYGIQSAEEARAYLQHPILGPRLETCCRVLLTLSGRTAHEIFGWPDVLKLRSCMTLFAAVAGQDSLFQHVLQRYYAGEADPKTWEMLRQHGKPTVPG